jgi:hypothetical protein
VFDVQIVVTLAAATGSVLLLGKLYQLGSTGELRQGRFVVVSCPMPNWGHKSASTGSWLTVPPAEIKGAGPDCRRDILPLGCCWPVEHFKNVVCTRVEFGPSKLMPVRLMQIIVMKEQDSGYIIKFFQTISFNKFDLFALKIKCAIPFL